MKAMRTIFLIVFLVIAGNSLHAQDLTFSVTAEAGVGMSDMDVNNIKTDPLFTYRGGMGVELICLKTSLYKQE